MGKRGEFLSCTGYPECKTTMNFDAEGKPVLASRPTEHVCEKCGKPMVIREGRAGRSWPAPAIPSAATPRTWTPRATRSSRSTWASTARSAVRRWRSGGARAARSWAAPPIRSAAARKPVPDELKEKLKAEVPAAAPKKEVPQVEVSETCPECGSPMRLQTNRRRGTYFLGCSKYPKCKGTRQPSAELLEQLAESGAVTG